MWPYLARFASLQNLADGIDIDAYLVFRRIDIAIERYEDDLPSDVICYGLVMKALAEEAKDVEDSGMKLNAANAI